jgi:entericidin B
LSGTNFNLSALRFRDHRGSKLMCNKLSTVLAFLLLFCAVPLLGACNTTAGAGQDLSATGHAVTNAAEKAKPR